MLHAAWIEYERDRARYLAVAMIYYALISLVPLLLLLLAALGLSLRFSPIAEEARRRMLLAVEGAQRIALVEHLLTAVWERCLRRRGAGGRARRRRVRCARADGRDQ